MSGSLSPCRRSRWAMRQLNPELSIVTTTSGRISSIARTVSRTCLRISGARGNTSATPATARSARGTRLVSPSCAMLSPPMPAIRSRPPVRSRNAAISAPPIASPDGSSATMKINGWASWPPIIVPWSWCGDTHHEQPGLVGGADHFGAVEDKRRAGFGGDPPQPRLGGEDDGAYPDRRSVDALLLARLCRLDEHPARPVATQPGAAPQQPVGPFDRLDPEDEPLLHDHRLADVERADRSGEPQPVIDIGFRPGIRLEPAEPPGWQQSIRLEQVVDPDHPKPFAL